MSNAVERVPTSYENCPHQPGRKAVFRDGVLVGCCLINPEDGRPADDKAVIYCYKLREVGRCPFHS